mmetsp:Transcript_7350/g.11980  ORF Transcript_7350/g.11980 Transcript_7350/m.11980 type:complete len:252 (-) Transcript_7350:1830-2585(-)
MLSFLAFALAFAFAAAPGPSARSNSLALFFLPIPISFTTLVGLTTSGVLSRGFLRPPFTTVIESASPSNPPDNDLDRDFSFFSADATERPGKRMAMDNFRAASTRSFFRRASFSSGVSFGITFSGLFFSGVGVRALPEATRAYQSNHFAQCSSTLKVLELPTITIPRRARVSMTFKRRQSAKKPTVPSLLLLTAENIMRSFSRPWKLSTEATSRSSGSASSGIIFLMTRFNNFTCARYGVTTPISVISNSR